MSTSPIRRNKHIAPLSHEHHDGLLFCWKIRQGLKHHTDPGRILDHVRYFWQEHLQPHFQEEEQHVFILPGDEKTERAVSEHRRIAALTEGLLNGPGERTVQQLALLANTVDEHIRYEERDLFPYLEQRLSEAQLEAIGRHLKAAPHACDSWPDEYWRSPNRSHSSE